MQVRATLIGITLSESCDIPTSLGKETYIALNTQPDIVWSDTES